MLDNNLLPITAQLIKEHSGTLKGATILHINHNLKDIYIFNDLLKRAGAKVYFIGIPYRAIEEKLEDFDYPFLTAIRREVLYEPFSNIENNLQAAVPANKDLITIVIRLIRYTIENLILPTLERRGKFIIIEDGGYSAFLRPYLEKIGNFKGSVEQTESGSKIFLKFSPNLHKPVVSISRSLVKQNFESYFVGQRIYEETNLLLYSVGEFLRFRKVIVSGYGVVGRQVALSLKANSSQVYVTDKDPRAIQLAQLEGFQTVDTVSPELFADTFAFLGCTGFCSFSFDLLKNFLNSQNDRYFLISGSSKRSEFWDLIKFFEQGDRKCVKKYPFLKKIKNISIKNIPAGLEYSFRYDDRTRFLILVAGGAPVNFYRPNGESIPEKAIDPINALLTLSAVYLLGNKVRNKGLTFVGKKDGPNLCLTEEQLMQRWCDCNQIKIPHNDILSGYFGYHPLRKEA